MADTLAAFKRHPSFCARPTRCLNTVINSSFRCELYQGKGDNELFKIINTIYDLCKHYSLFIQH